MSDRLGGLLVLLFGIYTAVFARSNAQSIFHFENHWLQHRSERVRRNYEISPARRQAREDLRTVMFVVLGAVFAVVGLLVLTGVIGRR